MIREGLVISIASLVAAGWAYWLIAWISTRAFFARVTSSTSGSDRAEGAETQRAPRKTDSISSVPSASLRPLRDQKAKDGYFPRVSILKPIKGADPHAYENFTTFAKQDYDNYEILFAVADADDAAIPEVHRLQQEFPQIPIRLFIAEELGVNPKCANLHRLVAESTADVLVLSDGDIRVTPDYLSRVIAPLADPSVGLVTCPYRGLVPQGLPACLESLHMEVVFLPAVVLAHRLGERVAMGATLALRHSDLRRTGGFAAIADHLMDDYQLATLIEGLGLKTCLSDCVVGSVLGRVRFSDQWAREVRWSRGIRVTCPGKYWGLLVTYPTAWALVLCAVGGLRQWMLIVLFATLLLRWIIAWDIEVLLGANGRATLLLLPLRDLLSFVTWCAGLVGNRITWRGQDFALQRDGRLLTRDANRRVRLGGRVPSASSSSDASAKADPTESPSAEGVVCESSPLTPTLSPEYRGEGATNARRRGPFSRLVRCLDRFLRRREGIFEFNTDADCLLRVSIGRCDRSLELSGGVTLSPGDCVCDLHLYNDHMPAIGADGAGIAWANQVQRGFRSSLIKLAAAFESDPRFAKVKAVRGQTIFVTRRGVEQLQRFATRLHFDILDPEEPPSLLKRIHDLGENLLLWALVWTFNPGGLRNAKLMRERHWFFMSREMLVSKHGRNDARTPESVER